MLETFEKCLQEELIKKDDLVHLRGQKRKMIVCTVKNGIIEEFSNINLGGISARALVNNKSWGFSSTNGFDLESVKGALRSAVSQGKVASKLKRKATVLPPIPNVDAQVITPTEKKIEDLQAKEILEYPMEAFKAAKELGSKIADIKATFLSIEDSKVFLSSEGSRISEKNTRVSLFVDVIAKSGGMLCPASENLGHSGGAELFDRNSPQSLGRSVAEQAESLLDKKAPPSGQFRVVIHPTLCATLLHEATGHPLEADLAMAGGGFGNRIGEPVSSELVTIYDAGHVEKGLGYFKYDDEGVECKRTDLIKDGILRSFMHDRTSAVVADVEPTGNAHAWNHSVEPLIRQTNIGLDAGDHSLEEMIEDIDNGLLLHGTFGGQADVNADFTFGFQNATWIRQGRLSEELRGANVAGNAIDVFKEVDAVGKEVILRPGACGKHQPAIQGRVVPAIRCMIQVGGTGG